MAVKVAVLCGGASREAAVSRSSAREVAHALAQHVREPGKGETVMEVTVLELDARIGATLLAEQPQVVFPVLHGSPGEDGTVQGFLEILGLPYVGSGVGASAAAMDKSLAKCLFRRAGLPVCEELVFEPGTPVEQACERTRAELGDHVVIKPTSQGSGIGTTPVMNGGDLTWPFADAFALGGAVMVEPFLLGREVTVGVLDLQGSAAQAFTPIEITTPPGTWYDYEHRYTPGRSEHIIPARVAEEARGRLEAVALAAHRVLGCRDLSRADFIVTDDDEIRLLEVNTIPGMTPTSLYPDGARAMGIEFEALMQRLVASALAR